MQNWRNIILLDLEKLIKEETKVSLSQKRHLERIINRYAEFVKSEYSRENLTGALRSFIYKTRGKDANGVGDIYKSLITVNKHWGKNAEFTIRKKKDINGLCKVTKEVWGRPRLFETCEWINERNKEIAKREKK